jgi:uncharacterized protein YyaL (SSP411 family)
MLSMLEAIVDDPTPGPSVVPEKPIVFAANSRIAPAVLARVRRGYEAQYDLKAGGWGFSHKFLDADSVEYGMVLAAQGDSTYGKRVRDTLRLEEKIQDPAWGGAYQYSAGGDWDEPHFEKLISIQAQVMRIYALAAAQFHDEAYLHLAERVDEYVQAFLTDPDGAFYVSQDADLVEGEHGGEYFKLDDAARRAKGVPRVDKHLYARENGWMIASLADLYAASGDRKYLEEAERAADWVIANRALDGGGFRHDEKDAAGPYLGDTLAMGQGFLALYRVTAEQRWMDRARATLPFLVANFSARNGAGFVTSRQPMDQYSQITPERDENIALARFSNLLYRYSGDDAAQKIAAQTMRYLVTPAIATEPLSGGELLAIHETASEPLHVAIVGAKEDEAARKLYQAALASLRSYERLEWVSGTVPNAGPREIAYPALTQAAAFVCHEGRCGAPIYLEAGLRASIEKSANRPELVRAQMGTYAKAKSAVAAGR